MAVTRAPLLLLLLSAHMAPAQDISSTPHNEGYDSTYVLDYTHIVTGRVYLSTKTNAFQLIDRDTRQQLLYRPNNRLNLGIGASYRAFTLNVGFGFGFLNRDRPVKGETDYIDAQLNYFARRFATNVFFQAYQGYYVDGRSPAELNWASDYTTAFRADVFQANAGFSSLYIFNNERFSYRAAYNQDAWQRRSAGSFLAGAYLTYYTAQGDSSLMPAVLAPSFNAALDFSDANFVDMGLMGGYAHTFVVRRHWFLNLSTAVGLGGSYYSTRPAPVDGSGTRGRVNPGAHLQLRSATGYNSDRTCVAVSFNAEGILHSLGESNAFQWTVGNLRFNVAHRFNVRMRQVDRVLRGIRYL